MAARVLSPLLLAAATLVATGAGAGEVTIDFPGIAVEESRIAYRCGSTDLDVRYVNAGRASLAIFDWNGERIVASAGMSGSGVRYVAGRYVWWSKGGNASLYDEMAGEDADPLVTCVEQG